MSDQLTLSAEARERAGKGASRAMRREGRVPAVIYGGNKDPEMVHLEERALMKMLHTGSFMNSVIMVDVGGAETRTLPKDVQFHPVSDRPIHVDFLRIAKDAAITVGVPVSFIDEEKSPGIKRGGVLNIVRHELELSCPADRIPERIEISLAGLDIGDSIHISAVTLPEKVVSTIDDRDFTIATVVAPSAIKQAEADAIEAEAAAAEAPEGEEGEAEGGEASGEAAEGAKEGASES
ncbi:MAG: 50S ribosomal protein L25/general stress protein Ctc [Sphingomonadaceae bacterium]|nr:50S ribosomal protein L25/general stress protein Ctc [Sphingomonadaceae bacterium]